jgi:hypothetical protein
MNMKKTIFLVAVLLAMMFVQFGPAVAAGPGNDGLGRCMSAVHGPGTGGAYRVHVPDAALEHLDHNPSGIDFKPVVP